jgi:hypothetical protein
VSIKQLSRAKQAGLIILSLAALGGLGNALDESPPALADLERACDADTEAAGRGENVGWSKACTDFYSRSYDKCVGDMGGTLGGDADEYCAELYR